jgi:hypothetical protein
MTTVVELDRFVIGRSQKCDVVIPTEGLSRQHCEVEVNDGTIFVTDLDSANGVFIDDFKIPANQKTRYLSTSKLICGSVEIIEFSFIDVTSNIPSINSSLLSGESANYVEKKTKPAGIRTKMERSVDYKSKMSKLHPGIKGFLLLALIGVVSFVFNNILSNNQTTDDELYQLQHEDSMKNKRNDGSIKTRNF